MKHRIFCFCLGVLTLLQIQFHTCPTWADLPDVRLHESADAGELYLSRLVFFGESTTAHLSRRGGVLDTPEGRGQVLRDESGTRMLDRRILSSPVVLYDTDGTSRQLPFSDAVAELRPEILVLSFGLNGILEFNKEPDLFIVRYRYLIGGIRERSPETRIILQSVYPVRSAGKYPVEPEILNAYINRLNERIEAIAASEKHVKYIDSAACLRDESGALRAEYDVGDGIHLNNAAYGTILHFFRTHPWNFSKK